MIERAMVDAFISSTSLLTRSLAVSTPMLEFGGREVRAAEVPAAGGVCTARSLAKLYAAFIGEVDGVRILDAATVADATVEQSNGPDEVLKLSSRFGLGFWLPCDVVPLGGPRSFGHPGAGGSLGFADPDSGLAFGYIMNKMGGSITGDQRTLTLIEACASAI
jgi:CubicO group peptidase (beta-lactamase class C family)